MSSGETPQEKHLWSCCCEPVTCYKRGHKPAFMLTLLVQTIPLLGGCLVQSITMYHPTVGVRTHVSHGFHRLRSPKKRWVIMGHRASMSTPQRLPCRDPSNLALEAEASDVSFKDQLLSQGSDWNPAGLQDFNNLKFCG